MLACRLRLQRQLLLQQSKPWLSIGVACFDSSCLKQGSRKRVAFSCLEGVYMYQVTFRCSSLGNPDEKSQWSRDTNTQGGPIIPTPPTPCTSSINKQNSEKRRRCTLSKQTNKKTHEHTMRVRGRSNARGTNMEAAPKMGTAIAALLCITSCTGAPPFPRHLGGGNPQRRS